MTHEEYLFSILSSLTDSFTLKSRESNVVEFKESYNKNNIPKYAKTMAGFANNRGGYILFGISDAPRIVKGLNNFNFDNLNQERFTDSLNSLFEPEIVWDSGIIDINVPINENQAETKRVGWIYTYESDNKPIIAIKTNESEKISSGDIYYRYRARTQKIKYTELSKIIENRLVKEREHIIKLLEIIRKSDTANLGIINYSSGHLTTPYGVDVSFDRKLITQVLKKAKYIKEGSFNEIDGIPVLKVTGNIDLAEEIPVPEGNPDETHPFIQKQLAEQLGISSQDVYALVHHYKMKGNKKFHLEITTSKASKTHKFSNYALAFLREKVRELNSDPKEFDEIRIEYRKSKKKV
ncbi:MAG: ATP-binding protein [Erysipelotrichaceae bacterium]|nr:ATP-binding protein [Erysipelotrichaceae bacterium]